MATILREWARTLAANPNPIRPKVILKNPSYINDNNVGQIISKLEETVLSLKLNHPNARLTSLTVPQTRARTQQAAQGQAESITSDTDSDDSFNTAIIKQHLLKTQEVHSNLNELISQLDNHIHDEAKTEKPSDLVTDIKTVSATLNEIICMTLDNLDHINHEEQNPITTASDTQIVMTHHNRYPLFQPEKFSGTDKEDAEEYLKTFNRTAQINDWTEAEKVRLFPAYLKDAALVWYDLYEQSEPRLTWDKLQQDFTNEFIQIQDEDELYDALRNRTQGPSEPTNIYINYKLQMCKRLNPLMSEKEKIKHIIKGMRPAILDRIVTMKNDTLEQLRTNLLTAEQAQKMMNKNIDAHLHQAATTSMQQQLDQITQQMEKINIAVVQTPQLGNRYQSPPPYKPRREYRARTFSKATQTTGTQSTFQSRHRSDQNYSRNVRCSNCTSCSACGQKRNFSTNKFIPTNSMQGN